MHVNEPASFFTLIRDALAARGFALARTPGFAGLPVAERDRLAVAVAAALGTPSPVGDATGTVVWDVRPRPDLPAGQRAGNISVSSGEACLHTDSTFSARPERWFLLWCVRPAADGGASVLVDSAAVVSRMQAGRARRQALDVLMARDVPMWDGRRVLPVRVLHREGDGTVKVRYRADLLREGLARAGVAEGEPVAAALRTLAAELDDAASRLVVPLAADDLLIVDNHRVLHARQAFTDPRRHLLRVRVHEPAAPGGA
jgi:alpha-ketoglutarate-dependent taurine dioxygenase